MKSNGKNKTLPDFLSKYFWDIDFNRLNLTKQSFIISRILEHGDRRAVKWLMDNFKKSQIKQTFLKRRGLSRRSSNYWSKILCLKKQSQNKRQRVWPY